MSHFNQNSIILSKNLKENFGSEEEIEISPSKRSVIEVVLSENLASKITQQKEKSPSESSSFSSLEEQSLMAPKVIRKRILSISQEIPKSKHIRFD